MDEKQKEQFIKLTNFLGQVLGKQYEIVFHVIDEEGAYIAAIANNHISGRTLKSPLSAFASELIQNKAYLKEDFLYDYKALIGKSKLVRGSTFFIKNTDKLVGILCINHDTSAIRDAVCKIIDIEKLDDMSEILNPNKENNENNIEINDLGNIETLSHSIEEILAQSIDMNYLNANYQLSISQKEEIAKTLYEKGIFNIKGSVPIVAKLLKISEPSVYRYLKKFK
ncbi:PAS domain-containing protein [Campylobacter sp. US33a]|uniref:PAS domain-containing protein n=1 Tax=Campylobacter sp. CCS1377 TaxID=3158229 RepID=A0AAU7EA01_9BACT|nr:PAS domain-containing protein [Campylobacter sp. US33a]MCW1359694.1 PAS domain-containing protein [Campylobacter jejuni]TEY04515.1 DNA-binding protein [Campylobacter sp. US33a]